MKTFITIVKLGERLYSLLCRARHDIEKKKEALRTVNLSVSSEEIHAPPTIGRKLCFTVQTHRKKLGIHKKLPR
jgi:hypothetical protein